MRRNSLDKRFKQSGGFRAAGRLRATYLRFLAEVVAPLVAVPVEDGASKLLDGDPTSPSALLYQTDPNVRFHLPGTGHVLVRKHCDREYHHQPNEVNIWVPLTPCSGSNTLWCESAPGRADFRPVELQPGQGLRFWGHQCEHYTVPNETGSTRCSFDCRIIPSRALYRERYEQSHRRDGTARFALGGFFEELPWPMPAQGRSSDTVAIATTVLTTEHQG
jgi:hypothetical protein